MTERKSADTHRSETEFQVGKSAVRLEDGRLTIEIDEIGAPLPRRLRGKVTVTLPYMASRDFQLDPKARHFWSPACTHAQIAVDFERPGLSWKGHGYVDMNHGAEPLEKGFDYWDWSRTPLEDGDTLIRYVTDPATGPQRALHVRIGPDGTASETEGEASVELPGTRIWRIDRRAGALSGAAPAVKQTLEDTPFYSRSLLAYPQGASGLATHETLSCKRLRSPIVKLMLPFRMPRLSL
ncbi:MAG: hypothetical protein WA989_10155 [Henriciella sp.]|uniref:carotenoid 1,2-hydratase n=1 Tax=Henriciella sp. TaxID=1968823 RepID=UPI003C76241F